MRTLIAAACAALPALALAETPAELIAARDAAAACDIDPGGALFGEPRPVPLGSGRALHVLPCRATASQITSVALIEGPRGIAVVALDEPVIDLPGDGAGGIDWDAARVTGTEPGDAAAPDMVFDAETGLLLASGRVPPSMGTAYVTRGYRLDGGTAVLESVDIYVEDENGARDIELRMP